VIAVSPRSKLPRSKLLKYFFGQHILNGFAVSVGVFAVGLGAGLAAGLPAAMAAGLGALCVSLADNPMPFAAKARILPLAWICACLASQATALAMGNSALEAVVVVVTGVCAGLLLAWGRWAIPISVSVMLAMVFTLGAPPADLDERLRFELMFAIGGALYIPVALALTKLLDASGRRLTLAEVLREFAAYLRCVAGFYRENADLGAVYIKVVEQQVALSDHLNAARSLIVGSGHRKDILHLVAGIATLLEAFDGLVSAHADQAPLRLAAGKNGEKNGEKHDLARLVAELALQMADELDGLALDLIVGPKKLTFPDHRETLDLIAREIAKIAADPDADPDLLRAARLTRARLSWVVTHLGRLPDVLTQRDMAKKALEGVDPSRFVAPLSVSLSVLLNEIRLSSPIFRHALRLGLALGAGYALIVFVPGLRHGNWILLTVAVIMRASYSVTRQRRNERLIGSIIGCGIAGALLWTGSPILLFAVQIAAIGIAHAFVRVDYRVTSIAATIMALLALHLADPVESAPVLVRLIDTAIGAAIAFIANGVLPQWERLGAQAIAFAFLRQIAAYARRSLRWDAPEQEYRLARKNLMEGLAEMSESAERMRGDPAAQRALWTEYGKLIAAAYTTAAQIVTVRLLIRTRRDELDAHACASLLEETRHAVVAVLDLSKPPAPFEQPPLHVAGEANAFAALRRRCAEVLREAGRLRELVALNWS
jgi:uncharacterized membrane protein YccC